MEDSEIVTIVESQSSENSNTKALETTATSTENEVSVGMSTEDGVITMMSTENVISAVTSTENEVITVTSLEDDVIRKNNTAIARERFLRFLLSAENKECEFGMYENTKVKGVFQGCDVGFNVIGVSDLTTPIAVYESACLRTSDVLTITFDANSW